VTQISSKWTRYYKWVFPTFWFGFLIFFVGASLHAAQPTGVDIMFIAVPGIMMVFGFFLFKMLVWGLADEVYDCGESLLVRNRGKEERVNLSNIMNVNVSSFTNPPRITLRLDNASRLFGSEIAFSPETWQSINPFAKNKVGEDLIVRVDQARRKRAI
jgi:hypothetical protein